MTTLLCATLLGLAMIISTSASPHRRTKPTKSGPTTTCHTAVTSCMFDAKCRKALANVDKKCKVTEGRCSAHSLMDCAKIVDAFADTWFNPEERCVCEHNNEKCRKIHEKVYENPCFRSVNYLRGIKQDPAEMAVNHQKHLPKNVPTTSQKQHIATTIQTGPKEDQQVEEFLAEYESEEEIETVADVDEEIEETLIADQTPKVEVVHKEKLAGTNSEPKTEEEAQKPSRDPRQRLNMYNKYRNSKLIQITAFICGGLVVAVFIGATIFVVIERLKRNEYVLRKTQALIQDV